MMVGLNNIVLAIPFNISLVETQALILDTHCSLGQKATSFISCNITRMYGKQEKCDSCSDSCTS